MKAKLFAVWVLLLARTATSATYDLTNHTMLFELNIWNEASTPATPAAGKVAVYAKSTGELCSISDAGTEVCMSTGGGAGSGEANTYSSSGGGLAVIKTKTGVDLPFASFSSSDFDLAGDLFTVDATIARDTEVAAGYQPLDADLTDLADGVLTFSKLGGATASRCARFDGSGNLVVATADCPNGDTGGGGGEANTYSSVGGGLAVITTKVGVDLPFASFSSTDFDLGSNLITVDATLARDSEVASGYQPLDSDLTDMADGTYGSTFTASSFVASDPGDGNRGLEPTDNTTACKDPAAGNTSICTIGGEAYVRDTGGTSRELLNTAGGDYGDLVCASGTCTLDPAITLRTTCGQFDTITTSADPFLFRLADAATIYYMNCIVQGTSTPTVTLSVQECDSTGAGCAGVDGAATITCDTNSQADDGSLSNTAGDADDWYKLDITATSGTPTQLVVCVDYTVP